MTTGVQGEIAPRGCNTEMSTNDTAQEKHYVRKMLINHTAQ